MGSMSPTTFASSKMGIEFLRFSSKVDSEAGFSGLPVPDMMWSLQLFYEEIQAFKKLTRFEILALSNSDSDFMT